MLNHPKILTEHPPEQIAWLRASSNYTYLLLANGKRLISGYSLHVFAELFDENSFVRINRSNLVNRSFISSVSGTGLIRLKNKQVFQIPRRRKALLLNQYPNLFINPKAN